MQLKVMEHCPNAGLAGHFTYVTVQSTTKSQLCGYYYLFYKKCARGYELWDLWKVTLKVI